MAESLDQRIRQLARNYCEYCKTHQSAFRVRFVLDHIIARQHGGPTSFDNLALCCIACNLFKGPNIAGIDPLSGDIVRLFNPRSDLREDHFRWQQERIEGTTPHARATIAVLRLNDRSRLEVRRDLLRDRLLDYRS